MTCASHSRTLQNKKQRICVWCLSGLTSPGTSTSSPMSPSSTTATSCITCCCMAVQTVSIVIARFYTALFFALEQIHCAYNHSPVFSSFWVILGVSRPHRTHLTCVCELFAYVYTQGDLSVLSHPKDFCKCLNRICLQRNVWACTKPST